MSVLKKWFQGYFEHFSGKLLFDQELSRFTYYHIGGAADLIAIPFGIKDLQILSQCIQETGVPFFILGKGSNLLVADEGFRGLIIRTQFLNTEIQFLESSCQLKTGCSISITHLLKELKQNGYSGLECLAGIPGLMGGAIAMNAGTTLGCVENYLSAAKIISLDFNGRDLEIIPVESSALKFQYRKNLFLSPRQLIWSAVWQLKRDEPMQIERRYLEILKKRKETQPLHYPSCGSVFKNPEGKFAWQIIDAVGLRGYRIGNAEFSQKHSNFIINLGNAKASDVLSLIQIAKTRAKERLGIKLEEEVIFLS